MEKIYGYKEKDVIGLAEFLKTRKGESLSATFERYATVSGKAKGTVRNLYYALAKTSRSDAEFCKKYLDGKPLNVGKIVEFDGEEERKLIKEILLAKKDGMSVRGKIMELAGGDGKTALRYQNKFRGAVKNKPRLIAEIIKELKDEGTEINSEIGGKKVENLVPETQFLKLKSEINNLVGKIAAKTRRENDYLKERIAVLERENLRLSNLLYGEGRSLDALNFFRTRGGENVLN